MFKTVSVRRKKLRIRIGDKEGLLNSYNQFYLNKLAFN